MTVVSAWRRRLALFASLSADDHQLLEESTAGRRHYPSHDSLAKAGDPADRLFVLLSGIACRFKLLTDGRRQILDYLLPGDMCDPRQLLAVQFDHSICALVPSEAAMLNIATVERLERSPNIALAMSRCALTKHAISREWLVNVGHRTAFERLAHLMCEIFVRLESVGLASAHTFEFPLTQAELGDTLALSSVHVNRTLMEMRRLKLVTFQNRQIHIHDYRALCAASGFDSAYLLFATEQVSLTPLPARA